MTTDDEKKKASFTVCFAGYSQFVRPLSQEGEEKGCYSLGRGRPDDVPTDVDIWLWGGISLLTQDILSWAAGIRYLGQWLCLFPVAIIILFEFWSSRIQMRWYIIASLLLVMVAFWIYVYIVRVIKVNKLVQEELAPKLRSTIGYDVICYQRPWCSYYRIMPIATALPSIMENETSTASSNGITSGESGGNAGALGEYQELDDRNAPQVVLENTMAFSMSNSRDRCWDWQGYTYTVLPSIHKHPALTMTAWTWGGFVETVQGRVFQAENESPPLIDLCRRRRWYTLANVAMYAMWFVIMVDEEKKAEDDSTVSDVLVLIMVLCFFVVMVLALCFARYWELCCTDGPLFSPHSIHEAIESTMSDFGPIFESRTGLSLSFEKRDFNNGRSYGYFSVSQAPTNTTNRTGLPAVV